MGTEEGDNTPNMKHYTTAGSNNQDADVAAWEAGKGAVIGASKWGLAFLGLGGVAYAMSPIYKGLTIQFKVYIQMSGMILGSCLEADSRLRDFEAKVRIRKRMIRDQAMWEQFEKEYPREDESKR